MKMATEIKIKKKHLPKSAKIAATHALSDLGFSIRNTAKVLGIAKGSVENYLKEIPDKKWDEFKTTIRKLVEIREDEIANETLGLIGQKLSKAEFSELARWYKTIREIQGRVKSLSSPEQYQPPSINIFLTKNEKIIKIVQKAQNELRDALSEEITEK